MALNRTKISHIVTRNFWILEVDAYLVGEKAIKSDFLETQVFESDNLLIQWTRWQPICELE